MATKPKPTAHRKRKPAATKKPKRRTAAPRRQKRSAGIAFDSFDPRKGRDRNAIEIESSLGSPITLDAKDVRKLMAWFEKILPWLDGKGELP